jgi:hypothetical protein
MAPTQLAVGSEWLDMYLHSTIRLHNVCKECFITPFRTAWLHRCFSVTLRVCTVLYLLRSYYIQINSVWPGKWLGGGGEQRRLSSTHNLLRKWKEVRLLPFWATPCLGYPMKGDGGASSEFLAMLAVWWCKGGAYGACVVHCSLEWSGIWTRTSPWVGWNRRQHRRWCPAGKPKQASKHVC